MARVAHIFTARRNVLPAYKGRGRGPAYGERVRPLPRTHKGKTHCRDASGCHGAVGGGRADGTRPSVGQPGAGHRQAGRCGVSVCGGPRTAIPGTGVTTNLPVSAYALWCLYATLADEEVPLAAKQMLGAHRAFVFGGEIRSRLPDLVLLAGNILTYVDATAAMDGLLGSGCVDV